MDKGMSSGARPGEERPQESGAAAPGRGGRTSRQRKTTAVLRLLRGEALELVSRSLGVTAATLTGWRDAFLAAGEATLTAKPSTGEELESDRLKARLGAALIERDLLNEKIAILEANRPLARRINLRTHSRTPALILQHLPYPSRCRMSASVTISVMDSVGDGSKPSAR